MTTVKDELTIVFRKPITIGAGEDVLTYESITLREPMAGELDQASQELTSVAGVIRLMHLIGKMPLAAAKKVGARDLNRASAYLSSFNAGPEAAADGLS
ncbi:phage tail assembly protein [Pseudomonas putida]|uniref:phage tail assembly protein n=1 Tax=Pseudomonas putida TaxID=303 RepID=UPI0018E6BE8B|nr:phage tail assembly protein [Pseudomonas putida]MBI6944201.1 phage tail assembly protein [Pseudomonas putida]MBI6960302.1 phage tail assembly protein [Pseudomonas putida]